MVKTKEQTKKSKIGKIEEVKTLFGFEYHVFISEGEASITRSLDNARIMSMSAIILNKLNVKRLWRKNDNGYDEMVWENYQND